MGKNNLVLIGGGGHARSVIDSIDNTAYDSIVLLDKTLVKGESVNNILVAGNDEELELLYKKGYGYAFISIGSIKDSMLRTALYNKAKEIGFVFPNIIDSTARISKNLKRLSDGVFIGKGAIINAGVDIGAGAIINTGAIIDHDCSIGDFSHIAPGVVLSGTVTIGNNTHIGTGSSIIQNISIGSNSLIGAGSVVLENIDNNITAFGVPCKPKVS